MSGRLAKEIITIKVSEIFLPHLLLFLMAFLLYIQTRKNIITNIELNTII